MTTIKITNDGVKGGGMSPLGELKGRPPPWKLGGGVGYPLKKSGTQRSWREGATSSICI